MLKQKGNIKVFESMDGCFYEYFESIPQDKNQIIPNYAPHYTNDEFKQMKVVFGEKCKTDDAHYSDRLWQFDPAKSDKARKVADQACTRNTALWVEKYLSEYFGRPVDVKYIMAGHNWSNGFPYQFFAWNWIK